METLRNKSGERVRRVFIITFLFMSASISRLMAQADVDNIKNSLKTIKDEQEKIAHQEIMSYVYMSLGFAVVIGIAWVTTVMARKRSKKEQEEKQRYILKQQESRKHGHGHGVHRARR